MKPALLFICLLFCTSLFAQDYITEWNKVEKYESEGKTRSAAAVAESIFEKAKENKNEAQLLKAFFFKSRYSQTLDTDARTKILKSLKAEINTASFSAAALMESLYAEMLTFIYNENRYALNQRTSTDKLPVDYYEWSGQNFKDEIDAAYKRSLKNRDAIYATSLHDYSAILDSNPLTPNDNRSLYDFLVQRYSESEILFNFYGSSPITLKDLKGLTGTTAEFQKVKTDSLRPDIKIIVQLLQNTESYYTLKKDVKSTQRAVLRRADYFYNHSFNVTEEDKDIIFLATLQSLVTEWGNSNFAYRARLRLAQLYKAKANLNTHPDYLEKALRLCNEIIDNSILTDAAPDARLLKNSIINQEGGITLQDYALPGKPMLALINYKNITSLKISYYKVGVKQRGKNFCDSIIRTRKPVLEKIITVPERNDYFAHSTEVILPPLEQGEYIVAARNAAADAQVYGYAVVSIAKTVLLEQDAGNVTNYQILERETGIPVNRAIVKVGDKKYHSDKNGRVAISAQKPPVPKKKDSAEKRERTKEKAKKIKHNLPVEVVYKGDTLYNSFYNTYNNSYEREEEDDEDFPAWAQLFSDRAIYRPGQTVYFKGIIMQFRKGQYNPVQKVFCNVKVIDASHNTIKTFRLQANEFGSFTGEFTLPANGLTGNFRITVDEDDDTESDPLYSNRKDEHPFWDYADFEGGDLTFKVEEYKRPTYNVSFKPITDDIHLNEDITLTGTAKSYSGAPVNGAKVTYRVVRQASMTLYDYNGSRGSNKVAGGEAITDGSGNFKVTFKAEPDKEYNRKGLPVFTYTVYATVTDSNGETRDASGSARVGYHSLDVSVSIPDIVNPKNKNNITLSSQNLNGQTMPCEGEVSIYKMAEDNRVLASRPWESPEIQTIGREEFEKYFPYIPYLNVVKDSVIKAERVYFKKVSTLKDKELLLANMETWKAGAYQVVFTAKDSANNEVTANTRFTLKRDTDVLARRLTYENKGAKSGRNGYYEIQLSTSLPLLYVNISADDSKKTLNQTIKITNGTAMVKLPHTPGTKYTEVYISYVWQNELFTLNYREGEGNDELNGLNIATQTISDKLLPGSNETWSFTVSGDKGAAEVLASMYDASLDSFKTENWRLSLPDNQDYGDYLLEQWETNDTGTSHLSFNNFSLLPTSQIYRYEDRLNTFGFNITKSGNYYALRAKKAILQSAAKPKPGSFRKFHAYRYSYRQG